MTGWHAARMPLTPVRRRSVADEVFDQLLAGVLDGELAPGSTLPAERALSEALGVNRQAVREALQRLSQAGVVDIRHGGGTQVLDYRDGAGLDLLPALLLTGDGGPDAAVVRSLMELRACLGPEIARRCAQRCTTAIAQAVLDTAARMLAEDDLPALAAADLELWELLVDGSENIAYRLAFNALRRTYAPISDLLARLLADELRAHPDRTALAERVAERDPAGAAAAAERLLDHGSRAVTSLLASLTDEGSRR
jgi:GntR family transcriptional regulator, transcriptional repressor for pyruvate dehydrogenase complex